jgi:glycogen operon protein
MTDDEWNSPFVRCLGILLSGDTIDVQTFEGEAIRDDTFLLLVNAHHEALQFVLAGEKEVTWQLLLDTASADGFCPEPQNFISGDEVEIAGRATMLLKLITGSTAQARHESWKKRQFSAPHNGELQREKASEKTELPPVQE